MAQLRVIAGVVIGVGLGVSVFGETYVVDLNGGGDSLLTASAIDGVLPGNCGGPG